MADLLKCPECGDIRKPGVNPCFCDSDAVPFPDEQERFLIDSDFDKWQDRAYTAEVRVRGLEEERVKQLAEIERLREELKNLFVQATDPKLERAIAKILGHKVDCDWLLDGPCGCGRIEVAP